MSAFYLLVLFCRERAGRVFFSGGIEKLGSFARDALLERNLCRGSPFIHYGLRFRIACGVDYFARAVGTPRTSFGRDTIADAFVSRDRRWAELGLLNELAWTGASCRKRARCPWISTSGACWW